MLKKCQGVVVGLSGGADSVALLFFLNQIKHEYELTLYAVHVNHLLRGEASFEDEQFVVSLCNSLEIPISVYRIDVSKIAEEQGISLEAAGRNVRYDCFNEELKKQGAQAIAVAHNQNDNAETILMWLCRGTGLSGLCGIPPVREKIIRPLIETSRHQIEEYLENNKIQYKIDKTNNEAIYVRNKIRLNLIPLLKNQLNPNIVKTISSLPSSLIDENNFIEEQTEKAYKACVSDVVEQSKIKLNINAMLAQHVAIQRRIIRLAVSKLLSTSKDFEFEHIEYILSLLKKESGKKVNLPHGISATISYGELILFQNEAVQAGFCYNLPLDTPVFINEMNCFCELSLCKKSYNNLNNVCTKAFNYDTITEIKKDFEMIKLRTRQQGDKIFVKSFGGHKKLKNYFSDRKIPLLKRGLIPLVAFDTEVLWIVDEKELTNDKYCVNENTKQVLYINFYN